MYLKLGIHFNKEEENETMYCMATDFSLDWPFVATMKGVCKQVSCLLECVIAHRQLKNLMF